MIQTRGAKQPKFAFERRTHKKRMLPGPQQSTGKHKEAVTTRGKTAMQKQAELGPEIDSEPPESPTTPPLSSVPKILRKVFKY